MTISKHAQCVLRELQICILPIRSSNAHSPSHFLEWTATKSLPIANNQGKCKRHKRCIVESAEPDQDRRKQNKTMWSKHIKCVLASFIARGGLLCIHSHFILAHFNFLSHFFSFFTKAIGSYHTEGRTEEEGFRWSSHNRLCHSRHHHHHHAGTRDDHFVYIYIVALVHMRSSP